MTENVQVQRFNLAQGVIDRLESPDVVQDYLSFAEEDPNLSPSTRQLASEWLNRIEEGEGPYSGYTHVLAHARQIQSLSGANFPFMGRR